VVTAGSGDDATDELRDQLGLDTLEPALLHRALTHRSFAYENGGLPTNERLEFLGDSVLGVVITEALYRTHPDLSEGRLAKLRAAVVNARALAEVARVLGLGEHILLGRGEEATGGRDKASILSDTVEAVIGAVYLDQGFVVAGQVVHRLFDPLMSAAAELGAGLDWKTSLQELAADRALGVPEYLIDDSGPDHEKTFVARVKVGDSVYGNGVGRSKKEAEQQAAETAWLALSGKHAEPRYDRETYLDDEDDVDDLSDRPHPERVTRTRTRHGAALATGNGSGGGVVDPGIGAGQPSRRVLPPGVSSVGSSGGPIDHLGGDA
jgi:ribonuclease-3